MNDKFNDISSPRPDDCTFNSGVCCEKPFQCGKCGWNPRVFQQRSKALREKLRKQKIIIQEAKKK